MGRDPVGERRAARSALIARQLAQVTFTQAAASYIAAHAAGWNNAKSESQWTNTLRTYAEPLIGAMFCADITASHVHSVLDPIWTSKGETASRLRSRIECVLDFATAKGYRHGLNPARWRGNLDQMLPRRSSVAPVEHHKALPIGEVGAFMVKLRALHGIAARALEWTILTAARSGETFGATWSEIDLDAAVWSIPGDRMKAGKAHAVPLSTAALDLLKKLPRESGSDYLFPGAKGKQLSNMSMVATCRRLGADCVPHGFRSSFRDWCAERTTYPGELAELALAHAISSAVEAAYRRGTQFEKRRQMMSDWADFIAQTEVKGATVTPINGRAA